MKSTILSAALALILPLAHAGSLDNSRLEFMLNDLLKRSDGHLSACVRDAAQMVCVNGDRPVSMQSTVKLIVAIDVLNKVDRGEWRLDEPVYLAQGDLSVYVQPIAEKIGPAGYRATVAELLESMVTESDNAACDFLIRRLGGPGAMQRFVNQAGFKDLHIDLDERHLQSVLLGMTWQPGFVDKDVFQQAMAAVPPPQRQAAMDTALAHPQNSATAQAMANLLWALSSGKLLKPASTDYLLGLMRRTTILANRLSAGLPPGWSLGHRPGTGPSWQDVNEATNDIGIATTPDGNTLAVSAYLNGSSQSDTARAALLAGVMRAAASGYTPSQGSSDADQQLAATLDAALATSSAQPFNGVVLVTQGDKVRYFKAMGEADHANHTAMRADTRFLVASLTKQMTAAMVLRAVEAGRMRLDDPIKRYVPSLTQRWASTVLVRQLLNHTSGIVSLEEPLNSEPGRVFAYSNLNYDLLGQALAHAMRTPYATQAADLFHRCGMNDSTTADVLVRAGKLPANLALGYAEGDDGQLSPQSLRDVLGDIPAGGVVSTAEDLRRWNVCLHRGKLLSPASYQLMTTATTTRDHRWGELGYGFGIQIDNLDGITEISHGGHRDGFETTMIYYPANQVGVVILENTAWRPDDLPRAFAAHDRIRAALRPQSASPDNNTQANDRDLRLK